jgi:hypothetical protein
MTLVDEALAALREADTALGEAISAVEALSVALEESTAAILEPAPEPEPAAPTTPPQGNPSE